MLKNINKLDAILIHQATAYPKTELWNYAEEKGIKYSIRDLDYRIKHKQVLSQIKDFEKIYNKFKQLEQMKLTKIEIPYSLEFCSFVIKRLIQNPKGTLIKIRNKII